MTGYSDISSLKKSSTDQLDKFREMMQSNDSGSSYEKDDNEWTAKWDKDKKIGSATVRFLPAAKGSDLPWVKVYRHAFKGPTGKWYIENSLTTIGGQDPLGELNSRLWNSGVESDKAIAREQKRKQNYYANVIVLKDPANPANEGQVKVYRFGAKVFDMIQDAMNPQFDDEKALNPFNPWEGADFVIKMSEVDGWPNYGKSYFKEASAISDNDDEIEKYWEQCKGLDDYLDPKNYKSYAELMTRVSEVVGPDVGSITTAVAGASTHQAPSKAVVDSAPKAAVTATEAATAVVTEAASGGEDFDIDGFLADIDD